MVSRFLDAYPAEAPNRPDFDPRALNTNAPQRIDEIDGDFRLDRQPGARGRLSLFHAISRQSIDAFQLVAGQNPDTDIHTHRSRSPDIYARLSDNTEAGVGDSRFTRVIADLRAGAQRGGAAGAHRVTRWRNSVRTASFPSTARRTPFAGAWSVQPDRGRRPHALTWGGDVTRFQLNGIETNNNRGSSGSTTTSGAPPSRTCAWARPPCTR